MKKLVISLVVLGAVAASAGAYYNLRRNGPVPEVTTVPLGRGDIVEAVGATGTLEAVTTVQVGTQVSGTIMGLDADFNSIVQKGQVIARLDPSLFQTQIDQARANLVRAEADVERLRVALDDARTKLTRAQGLAARQLIPKSELETAEVAVRSNEAQLRSSQAQVTQARATLNQNEVNLQHTVITAPIDGIVIARNVDVGQTVAASMQAPVLFLLAADLTKMKVNANIDESDVGRIRPGQQVQFRVDAYPTEEFTGTVSQIRLQPVVVQNVVTYATVIDVPNPALKLKPGMTANVTIEIARRTDVLRVANAALRFRPTPEMFAALGQELPPEMQMRQGPAGQMAGGPAAGAAPGSASGGRAAAGTPGPGTPQSANRPQGATRRDTEAPASATPGAAGSRTATPGGADRPRLEFGRGRPTGAGESQVGATVPGASGGDPERRRQMMERFQNMSPEDRERFSQRMRERGAEPGGERAGRPGAPASAPAQAPTASGARTIDSLFGPLPRTESSGRVWLHVGGQLKMVRVRLGVSDGMYTELLSDELQPGVELVTNVTTGLEPTAAAAATGRSPLMPQMPRGGPGGFGGVRNPGGGGGGPR